MDAQRLGPYLGKLRERAVIKQAELARRLKWSQAVLSRIESGEREANDVERDAILEAIGSDEARKLQSVVKRQWTLFDAPTFGHPDNDLLWEAHAALDQLAELEKGDDLKLAFASRLHEYQEAIKAKAKLVRAMEYNVAFVGAIGVGKSTALCRAAELEVFDKTVAIPTPVLESGGGGVTICEVRVKQGPGWGIIVEPCSEEIIRREAMVWAEVLLESLGTSGPSINPDDEDEGQDTLGMSKEITRALRNMTKLRIRKDKDSKDPKGKVTRIDEAKELALTMPDKHALGVEILTLMRLPTRDRRDIWYDRSSGKSEVEWMKETFEKINNGRHAEFSLPARIEIIVPRSVFNSAFPTLRLIDTKGIDRATPRADLEYHFTEPHTVTILCSTFNDAPSQGVETLVKRMSVAGVRHLDKRAAVLVLPRPGEALAVKDDDGHVAESTKEGYEHKQIQVEDALRSMTRRGEAPPVSFFNAREDAPTELVAFLTERVAALRDLHKQNLSDVIRGAHTLQTMSEEDQRHEIQQLAAQRLRVWAKGNNDVRPPPDIVRESLLTAVGTTSPGSIRASVRRDGAWPNFDYSHHIGYGSRMVAASAVEGARTSFQSIVKNLKDDPELADAAELIEQAERVLDQGTEDLLQKAQFLGQATYLDSIKADGEFWARCDNEWGRGQGYRGRIAEHNAKWFDEAEHERYGKELASLVEREWQALLGRLEEILGST